MGELLQKARHLLPIWKRQSTHQIYKHIFESPEGKLVLRHIAKSGFLFRTTFVPGQPERTLLNEGRRWLALDILKYVNKDPQELLKILEDGMETHANIQTDINGRR
jgi:hypothetical protein